MESWFTVETIDDATFGISEYRHPEHAHSWLCTGDRRALLIDTGLGVGRIGDVVRRLTGKPVTAVVTHAHWDHIGGLREFDDFGVHRADATWVSGAFPLTPDVVRAELMRGWRDVPTGFDPASYKVFAGMPTRLLDDHDTIDLGGRTIEVWHTPGHSPGHICLWDARSRYLFTGDLVYAGTLYAHYPSTDPVAYLESLKAVAALPAARLLPGHHRIDIEPGMVAEVRDAFGGLQSRGLLRHGTGTHKFKGFEVRL